MLLVSKTFSKGDYPGPSDRLVVGLSPSGAIVIIIIIIIIIVVITIITIITISPDHVIYQRENITRTRRVRSLQS